MVATLRSPALWLGLIGAIPGLLLGAILIVGGIRLGTFSWYVWAWSIGLFVFSILGLIGALRIIEKRDTINGGLMILAGVGLICLDLPAAPPAEQVFIALLFFIGGALILLKKG
jgi:hypothetical protein